MNIRTFASLLNNTHSQVSVFDTLTTSIINAPLIFNYSVPDSMGYPNYDDLIEAPPPTGTYTGLALYQYLIFRI